MDVAVVMGLGLARMAVVLGYDLFGVWVGIGSPSERVGLDVLV